MEIKINSIIPTRNSHSQVQVFGYTTKGLPGLEVLGLNGKGRLIKEKLVYLSKKRRLRYPLKRFVLCVEGTELDKSQVEYLELPLMICFWSMANLIPLKRLDNCFASARVSLDGQLDPLSLDAEYWRGVLMDYDGEENLIYLGPREDEVIDSRLQTLDVSELLNQSIGGFSYLLNRQGTG